MRSLQQILNCSRGARDRHANALASNEFKIINDAVYETKKELDDAMRSVNVMRRLMKKEKVK